MTRGDPKPLGDRVLIELGIEHGFGQIGSLAPRGTVFPIQVHGVAVFEASQDRDAAAPHADAVCTARTGLSVGIVTADCVPILVATRDGQAVGAIHAGWRGLAAGVIEAGLGWFRETVGQSSLVAAVGPAARGCCYEVDEPVRQGLARRYLPGLEETLVPGRHGRYQLDLPRLATWVLTENGVDRRQIGVEHRVCTICNPEQFESFRRDGDSAGRLSHFIRVAVPAEARVDSFEAAP